MNCPRAGREKLAPPPPRRWLYAMASAPLRIVTLNTWKNDGDYPARLHAMAAGLRALRPDIVLLQEVFRTDDGDADTGRTLAAALQLALVYAPARRKPRPWRGPPVPSEAGLAVLARGTIRRHERLALPSDDLGGERIALYADVQAAGTTVFVCCTHLSHLRGDGARRREQLDLILRHPGWRERGGRRVLGGDFNATADQPELAWLADHPELEVRNVFGAAHPAATHPLPPPPDRPGRCIDFLFTVTARGTAAPGIVQAATALDAPIDGTWPSDHAAVVADVAAD